MARTSPPPTLPEPLRRSLEPFRSRLALRRGIEGLAATVLVACVALAGSLLADRFLLLSTAARVAIAAGSSAAVVAIAACAVVRARISPGWVPLAWRLESRLGGTGEGLVTAVEVSTLPDEERSRYSTALVDRLVDGASGLAPPDLSAGAVDLRPAARALVAAAAVACGVGGAVLADAFGARQLLARFLRPWQELPRPSTVVLDVSPGDAVLARGDGLVVRAVATRGKPRGAWIRWRPVGEPWRTETLEPRTESGASRPTFAREFRALRGAMEYRVGAGDFQSPVHRISALPPPRPVSFRITYAWPEYTGRPPETVERSGGELSAVVGTAARIEVLADAALRTASIESIPSGTVGERTDGGAGPPTVLAMAVDGFEAVLERLVIQTSGVYRLRLEGADGVSNGARDRYAIRAIADRSPTAEVLEPSRPELTLDRSDLLRFRFEAADDQGIARVDLLVRSGEEERAVPVWPDPAPGVGSIGTATEPSASPGDPGPPRRLRSGFELDLRALSMGPGASAALRLRASDRLGAHGDSGAIQLTVGLGETPPEGSGWPAPLRKLEAEVSVAAREWSGLKTDGAGQERTGNEGSIASDLASAERCLALRRFLGRIATQARETARGVPIPGPPARRLDAIARLVRRVAEEDAFDLWKELTRAASGTSGDAGTNAVQGAEALAATRDAGARRLGAALRAIRGLLVEEELEELHEKVLVLWREAAVLGRLDVAPPSGDGTGDGDAARAASRRGRVQDLLVATTTLAAEIGSLASGEPCRDQALVGPLAESLESLSRLLLEDVVADLDRLREPALAEGPASPERTRLVRRVEGTLRSAADRAAEHRSRLAAVALEASSAVDPADRTGDLFRALAVGEAPRTTEGSSDHEGRPQVDSPPAPCAGSRLRRLILELDSEIETARSASQPDARTVGELLAFREVAGILAERCLGRAAVGDGARTDGRGDDGLAGLATGLDAAWRATAPGRSLGRAAGEIRRAVGVEEELAWKLSEPAASGYRRRRLLGRTQRDVASFLGGTIEALERASRRPRGPAGGSTPEGAAPLDPAVLRELRESVTALQLVSDLAGSPEIDPGADDSPPAASRASELAGETAARLEAVAARIQELRSRPPAEAISAIAWLQAHAGSPARRTLRLAARERALAVEAREGAVGADPASTNDIADRLRSSQEAIRRDVTDVAGELRVGAGNLAGPPLGSEALGLRERVAARLLALAAGDLPSVSLRLQAVAGADFDQRPGILIDAAEKADAAAAEMERLGSALAAVEDDEALRQSASEIEGLLASDSPDPATVPDPARLLEEARILREGAVRAASILSARLGDDPRKERALEGLAAAAASFLAAHEHAAGGRAAEAAGEIAEGRRLLGEALALVRGLRDATAAAADEARQAIETASAPGKPRAGESPGRDAEQGAADEARLREVEALQLEVDRMLGELMSRDRPGTDEIERLRELQQDVARELGDDFITTAELVELVSTLVRLDRDGRDIAGKERSLAADVARVSGRAPDGTEPPRGSPAEGALGPTREAQAGLARRVEGLLSTFESAGSKLSSAVPFVLRAFWKARSAGQRMLAAAKEAAAALEPGPGEGPGDAGTATREAVEGLLGAAAAVEDFLGSVGELRGETLEAIADQERGMGGPNEAHSLIEQARRQLSDAAERLAEGDLRRASVAQSASLRSIAEARARLRSRLDALAGAPGSDGTLDRLLGEEARALGRDWSVVARGDESEAGLEEALEAQPEMPFPSRFRDLVRTYLRAIGRERPHLR